ncbi:MAG: Omp85 superfamily domain [Pseudomonadota bacterium]
MTRLLLLTSLLAACAHRGPAGIGVASFRAVGDLPSPDGPWTDPDLAPLTPGQAPTPKAGRVTAAALLDGVGLAHGRWFPGLHLLAGQPYRPIVDPEAIAEARAHVEANARALGWRDARVEAETRATHRWWLPATRAHRWTEIRFHADLGVRSVLSDTKIAASAPLDVPVAADLRALLPSPGTADTDAERERLLAAAREVLGRAGYPLPVLSWSVEGSVGTLTVEPGPSHVRQRWDPGAPGPFDADRWSDRAHPELPWGVVQARLERLRMHPAVAGASSVVASDGHVAIDVAAAPTWRTTAALSMDAPGALIGAGVEVRQRAAGLGGGAVTIDHHLLAVWRLYDGPVGAFVRGAQTGPAVRDTWGLRGSLGATTGAEVFGRIGGGVLAWRGYHAADATGVFGLGWQPTRAVRAEVGLQGGWVEHFAGINQAAPFAEAFDGDLLQRYPWWSPYATLRVDTQPGVYLPTEALRLDVDLRAGGDVDATPFQRASLRFEALTTPTRGLTLRGHGGIGALWMDERAGAALNQRLFVGGLYDVHGFGWHRLGAPGARVGLDDVFEGGDFAAWLGAEARIRVHPDWMLHATADVGRAWDRPSPGGARGSEATIRASDLIPTFGAGAQVRFPLGVIGGIVACRLVPDAQLVEAPPTCAFHFLFGDRFTP